MGTGSGRREKKEERWTHLQSTERALYKWEKNHAQGGTLHRIINGSSEHLERRRQQSLKKQGGAEKREMSSIFGKGGGGGGKEDAGSNATAEGHVRRDRPSRSIMRS